MISFVVPAHNEARLLGATLTSIHAAARALSQPYEVIVVDDASSDGTGGIAELNGARVVRVDCRQIARTRNAGARVASGSTLIFVDADTAVPGATVGATIEALRQGAAGGGASVIVEGRVPVWAKLLLPLLMGVLRAARVPAGCYVFCSRAAFDAAGGFDEGLYAAEEIAFGRALRQQGPVVILRETVTTSGRKLRSHSGWEILRMSAWLLRGTAVLRNRERLSLWYGERRDDP